MIGFRVIARRPTETISYLAIGKTSIDVHMSALDRFDDALYVSVTPLKRRSAC